MRNDAQFQPRNGSNGTAEHDQSGPANGNGKAHHAHSAPTNGNGKRVASRNVLFVDDDPATFTALEKALAPDFTLHAASCAEVAKILLAGDLVVDCIVLNLALPNEDGLSFLARLRRERSIPVVVHTSRTDVASVVRAMKLGASDVLAKPAEPAALRKAVEEALRIGTPPPLPASAPAAKPPDIPRIAFEDIVGESPAMRVAVDKIRRMAGIDSHVLLTGETGTGKGLAARAIHDNSERRNGPFIAVNCGSIPRDLAASELFGHTKGAFTGAAHDKAGLFEQADGGTIFLDEIDKVDRAVLFNLMHVIDDSLVRRVGGGPAYHVDVRIVTASNRDLATAALSDVFPADVYFRLQKEIVHLPPLRERREDIPLLIEHVLREEARRPGGRSLSMARVVKRLLRTHDWRGNVRELADAVRSMANRARGGVIEADEEFLEMMFGRSTPTDGDGLPRDARAEALDALTRAGWNREIAARLLGVCRKTLYTRMRELGIEGPGGWTRSKSRKSGVQSGNSGAKLGNSGSDGSNGKSHAPERPFHPPVSGSQPHAGQRNEKSSKSVRKARHGHRNGKLEKWYLVGQSGFPSSRS